MTDAPASPPRTTRSGFRPRVALVLVAEGDEALREAHCAALASSGFMALPAHDAASLLERAHRFKPQAVVLDLALPGGDALAAAARLRDAEAGGSGKLGIVALAAIGSMRLEQDAYAAGCDVFMSGRALPEALVSEVVRLIARRTREESEADVSRSKG